MICNWSRMEVLKVENEAEVIRKLASRVEECAKEAIAQNGCFTVGLSGGSLVKYLSTGLPTIQTDWTKWKLFFCDERFVLETSADSTFGAYKQSLIPQTPLDENQFFVINNKVSLDECACDYEKRILESFGCKEHEIPQFDLLLLGMGPDGHTCSLFPGHELLNVNIKRLIAPISDSPKPPPERITMTYPLINNAKNCIFAMSGSGKAEMVKRIIKDKEELPAGMVKPKDTSTLWIVDEAAGSLI